MKKAIEFLDKSWLKRDGTEFNSGSVAITENREHASGLFESRTHLLDITSEQAALAIAVSRKDPHVKEVVTVTDGEFAINPLVIKILADHARRTGTPITYRVYDKSGNELFFCEDVYGLYYAPPIKVLEKIAFWKLKPNWTEFDKTKTAQEQLRTAALQGMETHFSSDSRTSYGAAVLAGNRIYFGGVYSSFDHRLNLHAEMVAAICAIMDGKREISHVGIVSNKFVSEAAQMCGCCRQFFSEIQDKTGLKITATLFSHDGTKQLDIALDDYLPLSWNSGESAK